MTDMAMDNVTLKLIADSLGLELEGAFLEKPYALSYTHIAIPYHSGSNNVNKGRGTLILAIDSENPYVVFSYDRFTKINDNSPFFNSLRRLTGTKIREVRKAPGERVLTLTVDVSDLNIESSETGYDLIVELFPLHPNIYLVGHPGGKIISCYRERGDISSADYNGRGTAYTYPKPRTEVTPDLSPEEVRPLLSRATRRLFEEYSAAVGFRSALRELCSASNLYLVDERIEPLPFGRLDARMIAVEDIYSHYAKDQRHQARLIKEKELIELIGKALRVAEKKLTNLEKDLSDAKAHLIYKDYGQLLYLGQADYVRGQTEMTVEGQTIPLDPKLTLVENAARYFKKYRKAKTAIETLQNLTLKTKDEITYLSQKKLDFANGSPRDIQELKEELALTGYRKGGHKARGKTQKRSYAPHYLEVEGGRIGFGLNDLQNETLTFELARKDSLFFHVKDYPGSHVLLLSGQNDDRLRTMAAELALYLSHLEEGEVYMAPRSAVKKNHEKRGLVNILEYTVLTIRHIREESKELFRKALKEE